MARMRRFRATSDGHKLIADTSPLCAQRNGLMNPSYSDGKCVSRSSHVTVAQSGPCRPMCGPLSLSSSMFVQLRMRDACAPALFWVVILAFGPPIVAREFFE